MNITPGTIIRTVILALALVNQILTSIGLSPLPIEDSQVEVLISTAWTVIAAVVAWWKNTPITSSAIKSNEVLGAIRSGKITEQDVDTLLK